MTQKTVATRNLHAASYNGMRTLVKMMTNYWKLDYFDHRELKLDLDLYILTYAIYIG